MPTLQRRLKKGWEELTVWPSLQADSPNDLGVGCTRLEFEKEVILEEIKVRFDGEKGLAEVDKDCNLQNRIGMEVYQLNVVMLQ
jgi:hypothetical protein